MEALTELIRNEIEKVVDKSACIASLPCKVLADLGGEIYKVKSLTDNITYNLVNCTGSALSAGETVQVFYRNGFVSNQSAYIGAAINKPTQSVYIYGSDMIGAIDITNTDIIFDSLADGTTVNLVFNAVISASAAGNFTFTIYVDDAAQSYTPMGTTIANGYVHCSFVLPITLATKGMHDVQVWGSGTGTVMKMKVFICGQGITESSIYPTNENDYVYVVGDNDSTTIRYVGEHMGVKMPTTLESMPLKTIGITTFYGLDIEEVIIPEGVVTIE